MSLLPVAACETQSLSASAFVTGYANSPGQPVVALESDEDDTGQCRAECRLAAPDRFYRLFHEESIWGKCVAKRSRPKNAKRKQGDDSVRTYADGGVVALAGFIYQLFGSISESIEVSRQSDRPGHEELISLEQFGQDAYVARIQGTGAGKLIQYKHSASQSTMYPGEYVGILVAFAKSCQAMKVTPEDLGFELVTDRERSQGTRAWIELQSNEIALRKKLHEVDGVLDIKNFDMLLTIAMKLVWKQAEQSDFVVEIERHASQLGVLKDEIRKGVRSVLSLFLERAGSPHVRQVFRSELDTELAGHPDALRLCSVDSRMIQRKSIQKMLDAEKGKVLIHRRHVVDQILSKSIESPIVVVTGNGGLGKSIAGFDSLIGSSQGGHFEFFMGLRNRSLNPQRFVDEVSCWRQRGEGLDGQVFGKSLARLNIARDGSPRLLIVYVDGIDENGGDVGGPTDADDTIAELIAKATHSDSSGGHQVTVVLSCRTEEDAQRLFPPGMDKVARYVPVDIFEESELGSLAGKASDEVRDQIIAGLPRNSVNATLRSTAKNSPAAHPEAIEFLRQPAVWGAFSVLDPAEQLLCLQNETEGLDRLAVQYLKRVEIKIARRTGNALPQNMIYVLLTEAACAIQNTEDGAATAEDWERTCNEVDLNRREGRPIFSELVSAGILVELQDNEKSTRYRKSWRWQQPWLYEYFIRQGERSS